MLVDIIVKRYLPNFMLHRINDFLKIELVEIEGVTVCYLKINRSDLPVFTQHNNRDDRFFVRIDASTREIQGADLLNYSNVRFKKP